MQEALTALAAGGPIAILAGIIAYVMWRKVETLHLFYEGDPLDKTKPGKIAAMNAEFRKREDDQAAAFLKREDSIRSFYEKKLKAEQERNDAVMEELNATLRGEFLPDETS